MSGTSGFGDVEVASAVRWFTLGLCALGAAAGFLVGVSSSPVVGVVLPLFFVLIGGTSGVFLTRTDLASKLGRVHVRTLGRGTVLFALTSMLFLMYGSSIRTGAGLGSFFDVKWSREAHAQQAADAALPLQLRLDQAVLRAKLRVVGCDDTLIEKLLAAWPSDPPAVDHSLSREQVTHASSAANQLNERLALWRKSVPADLPLAEGGGDDLIETLCTDLTCFVLDADEALRNPDHARIEAGEIRAAAESVRNSIASVLGDDQELPRAVTTSKELRPALRSLWHELAMTDAPALAHDAVAPSRAEVDEFVRQLLSARMSLSPEPNRTIAGESTMRDGTVRAIHR